MVDVAWMIVVRCGLWLFGLVFGTLMVYGSVGESWWNGMQIDGLMVDGVVGYLEAFEWMLFHFVLDACI